MLYQLNDTLTGETLGIVKATNLKGYKYTQEEFENELTESWDDYHGLEEHELDPCDVCEFVEWHNENWLTQIERVFITEINV